MIVGLMRAVGSRKRDIILQFLIEASFISFSGGTVGVIVSMIVSILIFWFAKLPFVSPIGHLLSFLASVVVGTLAGIYPSQKATRIQPVDVIRS